MTTKIRETGLYAPVKAAFERLGFEVKAEIGPCDVVAVHPDRPDEPPLIIELKTAFTLALLQQAACRLGLTPCVYVAVPRGKGRLWYRNYTANRRICKHMGIGLVLVDTVTQTARIMAEPGAYRVRRIKRKCDALLDEFTKREGDPNVGGSTRTTIVTAYRQDAERCVSYLKENGPSKGAQIAKSIGVPRATKLMADNHYGWFKRVQTGVYGLSPDAPDMPNAPAATDGRADGRAVG